MNKYEVMTNKELSWVPYWIKKGWFHWFEIYEIKVLGVEKHGRAYAIDLEVVYEVNGDLLIYEETRFAPMSVIKNVPLEVENVRKNY